MSSASLLVATFLAGTTLSTMARPAQSSQPAGRSFDAAAIKANTSGEVGWRVVPQPGGRFTGVNVSVAGLVRWAYELPDFQVAGGPKWITSDRFDVTATSETMHPSRKSD